QNIKLVKENPEKFSEQFIDMYYTTPRVNHSNVQHSKGYVVLFGNIMDGRQKPEKQTIQRFWRTALSFSVRNGDVSLFKDGKLIRSCLNANKKISGTGREGTHYNKY
ncbi:MAG: hypothetical protein ACTSX1_12460, partial [Candidatus Heimdallarchaeaceae archaeon]